MNKLVSGFKEYWPFLLPLAVLLPGLADFPFPGSGAPYSDIAITHFPNAIFLKNAVLSEGTIPLWAPHILSGVPFIAHPYSGLWYPLYWLALFFPLPFGLNLLTALHLVWAGIGLYLLLRQSGLGRPAALFGGLAFEAAPKLFAHIGAGHLMLVLAVCWTPWLLWSVRRPLTASRFGRFTQSGPILALIFFIDPRWALYAGALWLAWQFVHGLQTGLSQRLWAGVRQILLAAAIALPAAWLYLQYASLSTRAALTATEILQFSIPLGFLPFLLIAQTLPSHEFTLYFGLLVLALAWIAKPWKRTTKFNMFWFFVLMVSFLLSLGSSIPGMEWLVSLPGLDQLRIPPRALFLAAFALAALAADGMQKIADAKKVLAESRQAFVILGLIVAASSVTNWVTNFAFWKLSLWSVVVLVLALTAIELFASSKISLRFFGLLMPALLLLDLLAFDKAQIRFQSSDAVLAEDAQVAEFLSSQPGKFRVYSPSYSIAQQTAVLYDLELSDGVDPLQLEKYARFMESATGVPRLGYSVSLPPIAGDPATANAAYLPAPELLGLLNVQYVVSDFPLGVPGLEEVMLFDSTHVYRNDLSNPRAWILDEAGEIQSVDQLDRSYNRILIRAQGPGTLVLSELSYPGWRARVDGEVVQMQTYEDLLRQVQIGTGKHEVLFEFMPTPLLIGLPISVLALLAILFLLNRKKSP